VLWILGVIAGLLLLLAVLYRAVFVPWTLRMGATAAECGAVMPGDEWLDAGFGAARALRATRAVTIGAPPEHVWPWLAQLGRGAGFYALDRLDNGGRPSARHILSWVRPPRVGDASAIGYLRWVEPGHGLGWWMPPERMPGCAVRMAVTYRLAPAGTGSRLIMRVNADGRGWSFPVVLGFFLVVDAVMARRQLLGIRERAERHGARTADPDAPETGARDQFQLYEFVLADGERGGVPGKEQAAHWWELGQQDRERAAAAPAGGVGPAVPRS
jgi:hypothetical protein